MTVEIAFVFDILVKKSYIEEYTGLSSNNLYICWF